VIRPEEIPPAFFLNVRVYFQPDNILSRPQYTYEKEPPFIKKMALLNLALSGGFDSAIDQGTIRSPFFCQ
jgi:hypothetical protein